MSKKVDKIEIIDDGRVSKEKLAEIMYCAEQTVLDRKRTLDLSCKKDKLNFIKDLVAMSNAGGGYFIIGQNNDITYFKQSANFDWKSLDSANLNNILRKYIEKKLIRELEIKSENFLIEEQAFQLIHITQNKEGLPIPFETDGQYFDKGKNKEVTVFKKGDIILREITSNKKISYSDWGSLLNTHDQIVKNEAKVNLENAARDIITAIKDILRTSNQDALNVDLPIYAEIGDKAFYDAIPNHIERNSGKLRAMVNNIYSMAAEDCSKVYYISRLACAAVYLDYKDYFKEIIDRLFNLHLEKIDDVDYATRIVTDIYLIGALIVRQRKWDYLPLLIMKETRSYESSTFVYPSWIREMQVHSSRRNKYSDEKSSAKKLMIPRAIKEFRSKKGYAPDFNKKNNNNKHNEKLLIDSLCNFDLLYCYCMYSNFYQKFQDPAFPASLGFHPTRVRSQSLEYANDAALRKTISNVSDSVVVKGLSAFGEMLSSQEYGLFYYDVVVSPCINIISNKIDDASV